MADDREHARVVDELLRDLGGLRPFATVVAELDRDRVAADAAALR
jgi:hypothetical protein